MALITKTPEASKIENYRPIVLGNFLYNIISKLLDDQLAPIASKIVSPNQFGLSKGGILMIV